MRTLVTGGAGFIGSHVVEALLARGDEVHVVDDLSKGKRERVPAAATLHVHDIRTPLDALVRETGAEAIVHLAAQADVRVSVGDPAFDAAVNVLGTVNVLEAARHVGARVVFASTGGAIYGECERPARERDPCLPLSPYGAAKLAGEGYLGAFARLYGAPHVDAGVRQRLRTTAGSAWRGRCGGDLPRAAARRASRAGSSGTARRAATTSTSRTWSARALGSARRRAGGVFNVGTGVATSVLELYEICRSTVGTDARPVHEAARAGELGRSVLDGELAATALGFRPEIALASGIAMTWESIRST